MKNFLDSFFRLLLIYAYIKFIKKIALLKRKYLLSINKNILLIVVYLWFSGEDDYQASTKWYPVRDIISLRTSKISFFYAIYI